MITREIDRNAKIVHSLTRYYLQKGSRDFRISLHLDTDELVIDAQGSLQLEPEEVDALEASLAKPNAPELSHYYEELLASGADQDDLGVLGYIIDACEIIYTEGILRMVLKPSCES